MLFTLIAKVLSQSASLIFSTVFYASLYFPFADCFEINEEEETS